MNSVKQLLSIASEALGKEPIGPSEFLDKYSLGSELFRLLREKNGLYAFEQALHLFPLSSDITGTMTLEEWNSNTLWRSAYKGLADKFLFFAEDIFGNQYCLSETSSGVFRFDSETGETDHIADSIEDWTSLVLSDYEVETGWFFAHEWQARNGSLALGQRLQPKIPFIYGGEYSIENLWVGDATKGMLFKAEVALKAKGLPPGTQVKFVVKDQS